MSNAARDELELHQRMLEDDPLAPHDLMERFLISLCQYLKRQNPRLAEELLYDAVTTALMNYAKNPGSYNPELKSLFNFLKMAAQGDLLNALAKQKRKLVGFKLVPLNDVALGEIAGNINIEEEFIVRQERLTRLQALKNKTDKVVADDVRDRHFLELMQAGVRTTTAEYARILNIEALSVAQQREIVKRTKDRLRLRLKRFEHKEREEKLNQVETAEDTGKLS